MKQLRVVDAGCAEVHEDVGPLRITYDLESGVCAPEGPCSRWVEEHLSPDALVVRRQDCEQPFEGRWVRDGRCEDRPAWRWTGRLDPGHRHDIGVDFQPATARVIVRGTQGARGCPAVSPKHDAVRTEAERRPASSPQWIAMPAEGYSVVDTPEGTRLAWTPGPRLRHWLPGVAEGRALSEPMPRAEAQAWLDGAKREPTGLAVRHTLVEHREWVEGWTQRGVQHCERVLEQDLEQRLRPAAEGGVESPPMRATMIIRDRAPAVRCYPAD